MKYRKKPVIIDAFHFGVDPYLPDWWMDALTRCDITTFGNPWEHPEYAEIKTLEGIMRADRNDYIIRGIKGEIYPCKPDIFEQTYEAVKD